LAAGIYTGPAPVVKGDAKAELTKLAHAGLQPRHPIQRGPLGELEHHSVRDLAESRRGGKEIEVIEVFRVNIDEKQHGLRKSTGVRGDSRPYNSTHIVQASQALGCIEKIQGAPECRLFVADKCFVREDLSVLERNDRSIGDP
jgi:hypothetical protein